MSLGHRTLRPVNAPEPHTVHGLFTTAAPSPPIGFPPKFQIPRPPERLPGSGNATRSGACTLGRQIETGAYGLHLRNYVNTVMQPYITRRSHIQESAHCGTVNTFAAEALRRCPSAARTAAGTGERPHEFPQVQALRAVSFFVE